MGAGAQKQRGVPDRQFNDGRKLDEYRNPIDFFDIHQRCYPGRATPRLLLPPVMGITVYDIQKDKWLINDWVRGGCIYGIMPANGMVYTPPHACACYYQSKLNGFNALRREPQPSAAPAAEKRLLKGPAYSTWDKAGGNTRRRPGRRSDTTTSAAVTSRSRRVGRGAPGVEEASGDKAQPAVVADGKLFTSAVDVHVVYALDAASGRELWHFIAGGRVDSPPTLCHGLVLFGCADGCVYAIGASDGTLAWKFQAAPNDRKLMAYGQLESVWPLSGSVLVQDGQVYCVAGRSMFLDGGLRHGDPRPKTGELVSENVMDDHVPGTQKNLQELLMGKHMPVAMPDILSGDGRYVYMKSQTFMPDGKRVAHQATASRYAVRRRGPPLLARSPSSTIAGTSGPTGFMGGRRGRAGRNSNCHPSEFPAAGSCAWTRTTPTPMPGSRS